MLILHVVGARPNFMKAAPVLSALDSLDGVGQLLVHTGQHYDANMSQVFFDQLELPRPDVNLGVGSGSHAVQTARIMTAFEPVLTEHRPEMVVVYGDVNSTVAASLVCAKLGVAVGHVEAGLRSGDRTMPEEINRLVTDQLADLLFTPSEDGNANLAREGVDRDKVHLVGNVMIDTLIRLLPLAEEKLAETGHLLPIDPAEPFCLATLHRPANVDDPGMLKRLVDALADIAARAPVVFPVHPRTTARLKELGLDGQRPGLHFIAPLDYLSFLGLQTAATLIITDSGGIQEESTYLGKPCLTMRPNTERPVTVDSGTNLILGRDTERLKAEAGAVLSGRAKRGVVPPLWDGRAGQRIAAVIDSWRSGT